MILKIIVNMIKFVNPTIAVRNVNQQFNRLQNGDLMTINEIMMACPL